MRLIEITDKIQLNNFLGSQEHSCFQQSWEWGEFQLASHKKIFRLGVLDDEGKLTAAATLVKNLLPGGLAYFYCPKGIFVNYELSIANYELVANFFLAEIKKLAQAEKVLFLRFEPQLVIRNCRLKIEKTFAVQPAKTLVLDLRKSEEELLAAMHQKTRYNIRLAEKKGVKIAEAGLERFDEFWNLMKKTSERDGFRLHGKEHYRKMVEKLRITNYPSTRLRTGELRNGLGVRLFLAEHDGRVIVGNLVAFFGDTVTYVHGASDNEYRNTMASFLMQWHCIRLAKSLGFRYYDFYGIDEAKWPGVTRFKLGFDPAGQGIIEYPGTFDAVFNKGLYQVYKLIRKIRRG